ncbi:MAG: glycosyltransferase [Candidatus Micrarchaeota archaeon]
MKALIFSEGNGYGHVARDRMIAEALGIPIMTFGKGAECCRRLRIEHIEVPAPYVIKSVSEKARIIANYAELPRFLDSGVMASLRKHFAKADTIIVDGAPLVLAAAKLLGKKAVYITNDTSSMAGVQDAISRRVAASAMTSLLKTADGIFVPDFPPPLAISALNLDLSSRLVFLGPLVKKPRKRSHRKTAVVVGKLEKQARSVLGDDAIYGSDVPDLLPYYADAEMVLCHGGHSTMMEALSYGKRVIAVVDQTYSERVNNATMLERLGVGVKLDERAMDGESLRAAMDLSRTLDEKRLGVYKKTADGMDPVKKLLAHMGGS